jgi:hypothetical protein
MGASQPEQSDAERTKKNGKDQDHVHATAVGLASSDRKDHQMKMKFQ